jgi:hypothetical protein
MLSNSNEEQMLIYFILIVQNVKNYFVLYFISENLFDFLLVDSLVNCLFLFFLFIRLFYMFILSLVFFLRFKIFNSLKCINTTLYVLFRK